jgi:SAM-dependent methyltransferase
MNRLHDANLYGKKYFDGFYLHDPKRDQQYAQERARLMKFVQSGKILDIGCGTGGFLSGLDDRFEKYGYEVSEYAGRIAQARGIEVTAPGMVKAEPGSLSSQIIPSLACYTTESMDIVVFRGTLQHINRPMEALAHATRTLKPGGLLVILATPNTDSLVYSLWHTLPPLDPQKNWVLFGQAGLDNLLDRLGYRQLVWHFPYRKSPYARPIKDFIKFGLCLFLGYRWKFAFPGNMMECYARKAINDA